MSKMNLYDPFVPKTQVMAKRKVENQITNLTPDH